MLEESFCTLSLTSPFKETENRQTIDKQVKNSVRIMLIKMRILMEAQRFYLLKCCDIF